MKNRQWLGKNVAATVHDELRKQARRDARRIFEREIANPVPHLADKAESFMQALEAGKL